MSLSKLPKPLRPFAWHGVRFEVESGDNHLADCPFCGKRLSLSVNADSSQFACNSSTKSCGKKGNAKTFLHELWATLADTTSDSRVAELAEDRGLPEAALRSMGVAWHSGKSWWCVPSFDAKGRVADLRVWKRKPGSRKRQLLATSGVPGGVVLWGADRLAAAPRGSRVHVLEGEWDGGAVAWLVRVAGDDNEVAVAVPGARTLKQPWADAVLEVASEVVVYGDADEDGEAMCEKWWNACRAKVPVKFCVWPSSVPEKFDARDFVARHLAADRKPLTILRKLEKLTSDKHPAMPFEGQADAAAAETGERPSVRRRGGEPPSLARVYKVFNEWLEMTPDLTMALRASLAVHVSSEWTGSPVWMFLVGPPASGKSEILMSMSDAPCTFFQSSVTRESLVSGFSAGKDPSIIPKMIGRCAVFKDWTEMLELHPIDQGKVYGLLRGYFDGRVDRSFGNDQKRNYKGTGTILAGTTSEIFRVEKAQVGERFLKFILPRPPRATREKIIEAAILNVTREHDKDSAIREVVSEFLDYQREPLKPGEALPPALRKWIGAIADLAGMIRQSATWAGPSGMRDRELIYRPEPEMPTRLSMQLGRLAIADLVLRGKRVADAETWRIVERVAFNTCHGFNLDIVEGMSALGGQNLKRDAICDATRMHMTTLERRLEALEALKLVSRKKDEARRFGPGVSGYRWTLSSQVRRLWAVAKPRESHMNEFVQARHES